MIGAIKAVAWDAFQLIAWGAAWGALGWWLDVIWWHAVIAWGCGFLSFVFVVSVMDRRIARVERLAAELEWPMESYGTSVWTDEEVEQMRRQHGKAPIDHLMQRIVRDPPSSDAWR